MDGESLSQKRQATLLEDDEDPYEAYKSEEEKYCRITRYHRSSNVHRTDDPVSLLSLPSTSFTLKCKPLISRPQTAACRRIGAQTRMPSLSRMNRKSTVGLPAQWVSRLSSRNKTVRSLVEFTVLLMEAEDCLRDRTRPHRRVVSLCRKQTNSTNSLVQGFPCQTLIMLRST